MAEAGAFLEQFRDGERAALAGLEFGVVVGRFYEDLAQRLLAGARAGFDLAGGLASNGYGEHSPGHYSAGSAFLTEVVMTFMFLIVILGATSKQVPAGFAPIAIGLALTLIHLISIPVTNTSVNPARSTGPALLVGGWAIAQLWMFWVAPLLGAVLAGLTYRWLGSEAAAARASLKAA